MTDTESQVLDDLQTESERLHGHLKTRHTGLVAWGVELVKFLVKLSQLISIHLGVDERNPIYLVGLHRYHFRAGKPGQIVGIEYAQPGLDHPRPVFRVRFTDGKEDLFALSEAHMYAFLTKRQVDANEIPPVTH